MKEKLQIRQGDLLFVKIERIPERVKKTDHLILAEGETTGHMHQILTDTAELYEDGNVAFLKVLSESEVVHEEHVTIILPKGFFKIIRQREYTPPETEHPNELGGFRHVFD